MKKILINMFFAAFTLTAVAACGGDDSTQPETPETPETPGGDDTPETPDTPDEPGQTDGFLAGGDISLLPTYQANGAKYYDRQGNPIAGLTSFMQKEAGMNAMRVRLFVNPENASSTDKGQGVRQSLEYIKPLALQIKQAGMQLMLDLHYSDSWADPAKQTTPAAWAGLGDDELYNKVYSYTRDVLLQLKAIGAEPDLIQTGNEISYGMLWGPAGTPEAQQKRCYTSSEANWQRFAGLLKSAGKACAEVCPEAKVIIHTERVAQPDVAEAYYLKLAELGVDFHIIGLSYYPVWHGSLETLATTLTRLNAACPDKQIMIVETGYYHCYYPQGAQFDYTSTYPATAEGQAAFTAALIKKLRELGVKGVFWWWPEANEHGLDWNTARVTDEWYNASLFDNQTGRALPALYLFKE